MVANKINLIPLLDYINPTTLNYQEWVNVGMALKQEGYTANDWDNWSRKDPGRYKKNECLKKWETFKGTNLPVTGGTIVDMAKANGWTTSLLHEDIELGWDDEIGVKKDLVVVDRNWIEGQDIAEPGEDWEPIKELILYLETLFDSSELVGYVTRSFIKDGKHSPTKGLCDRAAGRLIQELSQSNDIGSVLGDYDVKVGAWIRFNPLDGKGIRNDNVTAFKYALVESDNMSIDKQNEILRTLELPIACLVHSGGKSLHAIVKIDAGNYDEYRKRVDFLYQVCRKNGLEVDTQNRNPSRLSRLPGVMRDGKKQFLIDTNIGKSSYNEWKEWIEAVNDDLPEPESMAEVWDNLPELSPTLIDGVLRQGHKMLIAGPSKAGKSFALIQMCIAIAEGKSWMSWDCAQGRVLYVNLELDRASCLHRFKDVYTALNIAPNNLNNIDIWNLRGKSIPMDKLAPKLIRRAAKKNYIAIIIDPIYKVITGDENSADQMANFCNQFDKVCTELGCSVVYCHHHSKGAQGGKRSMDRASGSGVFARDPDALLDLIELDLTEDLLKQEENKAVCKVCVCWLEHLVPDWDSEVSQDDQCSQAKMIEHCNKLLEASDHQKVLMAISNTRNSMKQRSAWRIEGTLREFPKFKPINIWFNYPIHYIDKVGSLHDIQAEGGKSTYKRSDKSKKAPEDLDREKRVALNNAYEVCTFEGNVSLKSLAEYLSISERTVRRRVVEHGDFTLKDGFVIKK